MEKNIANTVYQMIHVLLDINRNDKEREESRKIVAACHEIEQEQFEEILQCLFV